MTSQGPPPTAQAYGELQSAYDYFNAALFVGALPPCLITLQRRSPAVMGYYSKARFGSNHLPGKTTDEIALNPIHFKARHVTQVLQTLVHEMCHLWQFHYGRPSRSGYHNHEWAAKMIAIGLHPSSTGKADGSIVGQRMADYVIEEGPFHQALQRLMRASFRITWYDRLAERLVVAYPQVGYHEAIPALSVRRATRVKYSCPRCGLNAWAKRRANLLCGTHLLPMQAQYPSTTIARTIGTRSSPVVQPLRSLLHKIAPEPRHA